MWGLMPGGSAGTSFCNGTEISINFRAMASSPLFWIRFLRHLRGHARPIGLPLCLKVEHGDRTDRRGGAFAPLHRQADESELAFAEQRFEIAQAFDVGDVEIEASLVNQQVDLAVGSRSHRVDAE